MSPIHRLLRRADIACQSDTVLETIYPYPGPPWSEPRWVVENVGCNRDEVKDRIPYQIEEEKTGGACVMFTDGSYIPDVGGGAAVATEEGTAKHAYGPVEGISNYEMEGMALMIALVQFRQLINLHPHRYNALAIFSDSQAALDLLTHPIQPASLQYMTRFLLRSHSYIPTNLPVRLYWTPGHEGIELNEQADKAAKDAAEDTGEQVMLPISLGGLLRRTRTLFHQREVITLKNFKTKGRQIAEALNSLGKGEAAAIFQLRCGHCPLKTFLHRIGREDDDRCVHCKVKETVTHFLIYCKSYSQQRTLHEI